MLGDSRGGRAGRDTRPRPLSLDDVVDHFMMADELYRRERFAEAIKEFDRVLERKPGHFWAQYLNATLPVAAGAARRGTRLFSRLPGGSDPISSGCISCAGSLNKSSRRGTPPTADFQKAAQMPLDDNARYVLLVNRGVLRVRTERFDDAVADLKPATVRQAGRIPGVCQPGPGLPRTGQARAGARPARPRDQARAGGRPPVPAASPALHREQPARPGASADLDTAISREKAGSPYQVDDQVERGRLLLASGKHAEALASFDAALALKKDHAWPSACARRSCSGCGRFKEVIKAFDRYLETGKPLESVYRGRGLARAELGQYPAPSKISPRRSSCIPRSAVQAYRGWTHLVVDAPKLALRDFELAIELDPKNGDAYNGKGSPWPAWAAIARPSTTPRWPCAMGRRRRGCYYNAARIYAQCPGPYPRRALELVAAGARARFPAAGAPRLLVDACREGPGPGGAPPPSALRQAGKRAQPRSSD